MRRVLTFIFLFVFTAKSFAQKDSLLARIIFIGDAGEMDQQQQLLLPDAASKIIKDKTTVFFLGDNIYPHGMGLPGSPEEAKTQEIIRSQYKPMRQAGAPVYFIPGNHDWDRMGPQGLAKIKRQSQFLEEQNDSLLQMVPSNGCPDPVAINISDSVVVIAMDSEWWLFPYDKTNNGADCNCSTTRDVIRSLEELMYQNRNKIILLATHHPFQSYGTHGGYFSLKDHIFPLTAIKKNLYIPLPIIGSLYPFLRKTFTNPEDIRHPLYQSMIKSVDNVFKFTPNYIHVSGHEHGLQFINNPKTKQIQVVSGGGAKQNYTIKGKYSLFGKEDQGYVVTDILSGNRLRFTYYTFDNGQYQQAFQYMWDQYQPTFAFDKQPDDAGVNYYKDTLIQAARPDYAKMGGMHQFLFGKNYRKEWVQETKLPAITIDSIDGGLTPLKLGGGYQSTSLRLTNKQGKEYTLRLVEKNVEKVVPEPFSGTFVNEWLDDATSAQHPYSALIVAPIANAINVPHANPRVGVVATSSSLGMYNTLYNNKIALLEEREPYGKSDNGEKALQKLQDDNDNTFDARNFTKARFLDLLLGDWDRHADQWRFYDQNEKKNKNYLVIPRDRDMVLNKTEGVIPVILKHFVLMPQVPGFKKELMHGSNYYFYKSAFLNASPASQIPYKDWMSLAKEVQYNITDSVLETALKSMPKEIYDIRHQELLDDLKNRRNELVKAADKYYRFSNSIVDIRLSDKKEYVQISSMPDQDALHLLVRKINKNNILKDTLIDKTYPHDITKEIRLYLGRGDDSVIVDNKSGVRVRLIGGKGDKVYNIVASQKTIQLYDRKTENYLGTDIDKLKKHIGKDSANTAFQATNLYSSYLPLITGKYNKDDGIFLGLGIRYTQQGGFKKSPYTSVQQIIVSHSFATQAFNVRYSGEWIQTLGKADFTLDADIKAPDNTQNFFGRGNASVFDKTGDYTRYYRTRFNLYNIDPALRWRSDKHSYFSIGPAFQYYHMDAKENQDRFILNTGKINSYDSSNLFQDKYHLGIAANYHFDGRNNAILPTWGTLFDVRIKGMEGLNSIAKSFVQIEPQIALYKSFNSKQTIVLAERIGGGVTIGKSAFYQSLFLGSQGSLLGYRQYRFAGQHSLYNNLEMRIALTDFGNYIFKGQFGLLGFYDVGRVWNPSGDSDKWHNGVGGGLYLAPAKLAVLRFTMGYTPEGWYPSFGMGMRF
ncbi:MULTISPECIES: BamA/TamA family outer membrane protein [Chitinophagaceae]